MSPPLSAECQYLHMYILSFPRSGGFCFGIRLFSISGVTVSCLECSMGCVSLCAQSTVITSVYLLKLVQTHLIGHVFCGDA